MFYAFKLSSEETDDGQAFAVVFLEEYPKAADEIERLAKEVQRYKKFLPEVQQLNERMCKEEGCVTGKPVNVCFRCGQQYSAETPK